ncbi:MAG: alkaline phosphatase family protein, partial [Janthinobacterium lividum]
MKGEKWRSQLATEEPYSGRTEITEGTYADGVHGVFPTVTYPSHTTLVTGVLPAE